jgi:predicted nucleic acid-binding Zn ribbon protein
MKTCQVCQKEFEPLKSHPYQIYCSKPCKLKGGAIKSKLKRALKCKVCNSDIPQGRAKRTCSEECQAIHTARMNEHRKEYNKKYREERKNLVPMEDRICPICGTDFKGKGNVKYCGNPECVKEGSRISKYRYFREVTQPKTRKRSRLKKEALEKELDDIKIPAKFLHRGNISSSSGQSNL